MKGKTPTKKQFVVLLSLSIFLFLHYSTSHPTNSGGGYTGAPGDSVCLNCHNTGSINGNIELDGIPASVDPGMTYPITVTITNTVGSASRAGFQMVTLKNSTNTNSGTYSVPATEANAEVKTVGTGSNPKKYIGHKPAKSFSGNTITYDVLWTAPTNQDGETITFYGAALLGNGSGTSGDRFTTTNVVTTINGGVSDPLTLTTEDVNGILCAGDSNGTATAVASGGSPGYDFLWDNGESTQTAIALEAGTRSVTVTDQDGNTASEAVVIPDADLLVVDVTSTTDVTCFGENDGSASVQGNGGTGSLSYSWSTGQSGTFLSNLTAGTYGVSVTDENGCLSEVSLTIDEPSAIVLQLLDAIDPLCNDSSDGSISVSASGGTGSLVYEWDTNLGTAMDGILTDIPAGTYTVNVTDELGCTATLSQELVAPEGIEILVMTTDELCNGDESGTAEVDALGGAGGFSYAWSTGSVGPAIFDLGAGTYAVTATDAVGCSEVLDVVILAGSNLSGSIDIDQQPSCGMDNGQLTVVPQDQSGSVTYQWSNGATTSTINGLSVATYIVTLTDDAGCTVEISTNLSAAVDYSATVDHDDAVSCNGFSDAAATITITGETGPYAVLWSDGSTELQRTSLSAGDYDISITDATGCSLSLSFTVTEPDPLDLSSIVILPEGCLAEPMGAISLIPTGGTGDYTYTWSTGDTNPAILGLAAGVYSCTISDDNNCVLVIEAQVLDDNDLQATITGTDVTCAGDINGTAIVEVVGGQSPYTVDWSDEGSSSLSRSDLAAGVYEATITDASACQVTVQVEITAPAELVSNLEKTDESGPEANDGTATVSPQGGIAPYSVLWSNGSTDLILSTLAPGDYSVTTTDAVGCENIDQFTINAFGCTVLVEADVLPESCPGASDGEIDLTISGGSSPYSILWSTGDVTTTITNLQGDTYDVTVTDAEGCAEIVSVIVETSPADEIVITSTTDTVCFQKAEGTLTATLLSGATDYTVLWSTGDTNITADSLPAGTYAVTLTTATGCIYTSLPYEIFENSEIVSTDILIQDETAVGAADGSISVTVAGGTGSYTYQWFDESNTVISTDKTLTNATAGEYYLCATDELNCNGLIGPLVISLVTSSKEITETVTKVYPNPVLDVLSVESTESVLSVSMYDTVGRLVEEVKGRGDSQSISIDTHHLSIGQYLLQIVTNKGVTVHSVIVGR